MPTPTVPSAPETPPLFSQKEFNAAHGEPPVIDSAKLEAAARRLATLFEKEAQDRKDRQSRLDTINETFQKAVNRLTEAVAERARKTQEHLDWLEQGCPTAAEVRVKPLGNILRRKNARQISSL